MARFLYVLVISCPVDLRAGSMQYLCLEPHALFACSFLCDFLTQHGTLILNAASLWFSGQEHKAARPYSRIPPWVALSTDFHNIFIPLWNFVGQASLPTFFPACRSPVLPSECPGKFFFVVNTCIFVMMDLIRGYSLEYKPWSLLLSPTVEHFQNSEKHIARLITSVTTFLIALSSYFSTCYEKNLAPNNLR